MKKLLNTLYITSPDSYLSLDGETIVIKRENEDVFRLPLHNLESIVTFGYAGASPALMGACAKKNISLCFMSQNGRFLSRVTGEVRGNVLLRKKQYFLSEDSPTSLSIAKNLITGKLFNSRWVLERFTRDHAMRLNLSSIKEVSLSLNESIKHVRNSNSIDQLRGYEGESSSRYFSIFDELILQQKEEFFFHKRSRRPPLDNVNALLSFVYTLLTNDVTAALESVGLDPYVGFLHTDRPGRVSLALDMMEELRPIFSDKFVLSLINRKEVNGKGFLQQESGAIVMDDKTRKIVLAAWQERKKKIIIHPYLEEKIPWGLVPYTQALLFARFLRGDLDAYPPFLWK